MKHKHYRRNTREYTQELQELDKTSLSPAHQVLGLSKNEEDEAETKEPKFRKEQDKVKEALTNLKDDKPNVKGMFSRIYSIPSNARSKISQMTGQVPRSANVYGSHYPVARILNDNKTLVLHTSDYGTDGKTQELIEKIRQEVPNIFPDFKVLELHHPDYKHSARAMRIKSEKNLADYFKHASEKHPDENYRKHALDAHEHLTKIKKAEYGKPIHQKRIEHEGWDGKQNEQKRVSKIAEYLQKVGLTPDLHSDEGRVMGATLPSSVSINPEGDPHDQQLIHEAAHAMLTPVGMSLPEYQAFIGKPGLEGKLTATQRRDEMHATHGGGLPEQTAQHMEAGIARRSGVEPFRSPKRGINPQSSEEKARRFAHQQLGLLDEGIHTFDPFTGEKQYGDSVNALINARARGDKSLIKPVQQKVHERLKQKDSFDVEDYLAASEKDYVSGAGGSSLKKAVAITKSYTAGMPVGAPSTLMGGAALQTESLSGRMERPFKDEKKNTKKRIKKKYTEIDINKGEKGDWKKEGYRLEHWQDRHGFHNVAAMSPDNRQVGYASFTYDYQPNEHGTGLEARDLQGWDVHVHPEHRRKGLASAMYRLAEQKSGKKVIQGGTTDDGSKFWNQPDRKFGKSEFDESWFFEEDDPLTKNMPPEEEGVAHPEKPWISKRHPNGRMMWHTHPEHAQKIDSAINSKKAHAKILNSLKEPHKSAYIEHIRGVINDPNRHFIPTEEDGVQKLRARHVKSLIDGKGHVTIDTSNPNYLTFNRESHSQGVNRGAMPQIRVPIKKDKV